MAEPPRIARIEDIPVIEGGGVGYRFVRRTLGVRAFGVNAFTAGAGEQLIEDHDETGSGAGRHEELYVVIAGQARFTIDGTEHDAAAGTLVFVPAPESRRSAIAVSDGTAALVVGAAPGKPYSVSPWEGWFVAKALADAGDPTAAADLMGGRGPRLRPDPRRPGVPAGLPARSVSRSTVGVASRRVAPRR